jgi:hypothetical protein
MANCYYEIAQSIHERRNFNLEFMDMIALTGYSEQLATRYAEARTWIKKAQHIMTRDLTNVRMRLLYYSDYMANDS